MHELARKAKARKAEGLLRRRLLPCHGPVTWQNTATAEEERCRAVALSGFQRGEGEPEQCPDDLPSWHMAGATEVALGGRSELICHALSYDLAISDDPPYALSRERR